jgi:hypothetical protein
LESSSAQRHDADRDHHDIIQHISQG